MRDVRLGERARCAFAILARPSEVYRLLEEVVSGRLLLTHKAPHQRPSKISQIPSDNNNDNGTCMLNAALVQYQIAI